MTSKKFRSSQTFLRNEFDACGKWNIPIIHKTELDVSKVDLIGYQDTKSQEIDQHRQRGVHFYVDDYRMEALYSNPDKYINRLSQYRFVITPDYSLYRDMPRAIQLMNTFKSRWCGAYWQSKGLTVIPTVSWGLAPSFEFCFDGVEQNSIVAIGMIGCKQNKLHFLRGYNAMLERSAPSQIICFGTPFEEMEGNIIPVDYMESRKVVR